jgi:phosphate transport system ATP-binding protein
MSDPTATSPMPAGPSVARLKVETRQFSAWFGTAQVLRDINLAAPAQAVTALMGPSGSGKSTLIRCINRLNDEVPGFRSVGSILVDGQEVTSPSVNPATLRRQVGMLFQRPNVFPMSIAENILYGLRLCGHIDRGEGMAIVERTLREVGLWSEVSRRLDQSALSLSGGQQQRLCLARALAVDPDVILMDEPTSALDPRSTALLERLIRRLVPERTIIIVTHNMQQARRVSDFAAFLMADDDGVGELIEQGPAAQLFSQPRDQRTADFVQGTLG